MAKDSSKVAEVVDGTRDVAKLSDIGVDTSKGISVVDDAIDGEKIL